MAKSINPGVSVAMESNDLHVHNTLSALVGMVDSMPTSSKKSAELKRMNAVSGTFKQAFDEVAEEWSSDVMEMVHRRARIDSSGGSRFMAWTRHLYEGGNPANMGDPHKALFTFAGEGHIDGMQLHLAVRGDYSRSWSPVTHRTTGIESGKPYPAWQHRAGFMLQKQLGVRDRKTTSGSRTKNQLEAGMPKYVVSRKEVDRSKVMTADPTGRNPFAAQKLVYAEAFTMDYTVQKNQRDAAFSKYKKFTAQRIMTAMDTSMQRSLNATLARLHSMYGGKAPKPAVGRKATQKGLASLASDGVDLKLAQKYGRMMAERFRKDMQKGGGK